MNHLLEFTGALIYFALCVILFPVFLAVEILLGAIATTRKINLLMGKWKPRQRNWNVGYQLRHLVGLVWER
jgi:hypothetical protein